MYPVSDTLERALRTGGGQWYGYVEAWYAGEQLPVPGADEFGAGPGALPLVDGEVRVNGATPGVRRTLSATFAPVPGLWDLLAPVGTELKAFTAVRFPDGSVETVPQGVFDIDEQSISYAANGGLRVTAPDRWSRIQRARFPYPRASTWAATSRAQISALLTEVLPAGTGVSDTSTQLVSVPAQTWDRDRDKAIEDLARATPLDVFFDRLGGPVIRDVPALQPTGVWTVDAGADGVLLEASRQRSRQRTYNLIVLTPATNDGSTPWGPVFVWDNDPLSPTYAGPDPVNNPHLAGPFGVRPTFYSSPLLRSPSHAHTVGTSLLAKTTGLAAQLTLSAVWHPGLDDGDTIPVQLPRERRDMPRPVERHIVDSLTVPLLPHRNPMTITTRSTVADLQDS